MGTSTHKPAPSAITFENTFLGVDPVLQMYGTQTFFVVLLFSIIN